MEVPVPVSNQKHRHLDRVGPNPLVVTKMEWLRHFSTHHQCKTEIRLKFRQFRQLP